jgi:rubrerythrin
MANDRNETLEMFCTALEMKEKKRDLYEKSMNACSDDVGKETFLMLRDSETEHGKQLQQIYEEMKKGTDWADACRYYPESKDELVESFRRIAAKHVKEIDPDACQTNIGAIETGMELENTCIQFFEGKLKHAVDSTERQFLEHMAAEEREHYNTLADLKFYYTDPEAWFMEKGRTGLDGA